MLSHSADRPDKEIGIEVCTVQPLTRPASDERLQTPSDTLGGLLERPGTPAPFGRRQVLACRINLLLVRWGMSWKCLIHAILVGTIRVRDNSFVSCKPIRNLFSDGPLNPLNICFAAAANERLGNLGDNRSREQVHILDLMIESLL